MPKILEKTTIAPQAVKLVVPAPLIAKKRKAGQFVIIRVHEEGERIPLTIADADAEAGTITLVSQSVGKSTAHLATLEVGDEITDLVGPLGRPTHIEKFGNVVCIGGGIGIAPIFPITQAMQAAGNHVISILGARNAELMIMEEEMRGVSDELFLCTDDGSLGEKGFVSNVLQWLIDDGVRIDLVVTIGPAIMMKVVSDLTEKHDISCLVSLNSIMVDGTGMCGACRVTVGDETKFVCVHGPEFDAHKVDFDEMLQRMRMYTTQEKISHDKFIHEQGECCKGAHPE